MKAILQNFKNGAMAVTDVPPPDLNSRHLLVHNVASLVSAGTEKAVIELARMNPLQKAMARPDLVKKVLGRVGREGLFNTVQAVSNLVSQPLPLGYSSAGLVQKVGTEITGFQVGDRVACAGMGYANHAEVISVPRNLAVKIPENVTFDEAAFVTVGAIAMQGVRQAELTLGERVVVIGLGLVGQLTVQICAAAGCRVFGIDLDSGKVELARQLGMDDGMVLDPGHVGERVRRFSRGYGADAVLITAASRTSDSVELAAALARDRARVVAVGDVGLDVPRRSFYEKELELRLSRSYGPGRYDPGYEEKGVDYPIGYVRWTENRNMEAFLDLISSKNVQVQPLVTHRFDIQRAERAYDLLNGQVREPYIGILLDYNPDQKQDSEIILPDTRKPRFDGSQRNVSFGVIGAGQFAQGVLLPKLKSVAGVRFQSVATGSGLTAPNVARKYQASQCTSNYKDILQNEAVSAVLVATRHNLHAQIVAEALRAGKHVFVEKPLALNEDELSQVETAYRQAGKAVHLMVGFNRRFSPLARQLKQALGGSPLIGTYRINAGSLPGKHWQHDPEVGGGRVVGEVCHFIDLFQFLTGARVQTVQARAMEVEAGGHSEQMDNVSIDLCFADGSVGHILYTSAGHPGFPKERLEVFGGGSAGVIDNWRTLEMVTPRGRVTQKSWLRGPQKGHAQELKAFVKAILDGGEAPIPFADLLNTTRATFAVEEALRQQAPVTVEPIVSRPD